MARPRRPHLSLLSGWRAAPPFSVSAPPAVAPVSPGPLVDAAGLLPPDPEPPDPQGPPLQRDAAPALRQWPQRLSQRLMVLRHRPHAWPLLVMLLGLLCTVGVAEQTRRLSQATHERLERALLDDVADAIEVKLRVATDTISGAAGLFNASRVVTRQEFRQFYDTLRREDDSLVGIQGLGFSQFVPASQRQQLIGSVRAEGFHDFTIQPPGVRQIGSTILYLEPFNLRNQRAFGFDMYSEPTRRAAMDRAAQTGLPSMSGPVQLLQETNTGIQAGVLIYVPIYRPGTLTPPRVPELYNQDLLGWAYAPLRVGDLVSAALRTINNPDLPGSAVRVLDGIGPSARLMFRNPWPQNNAPLEDAQAQPITLAGRTWLVMIQLTRQQIPPNGLSSQVWLVLVIGAMGSLVAALITAMLLNNQTATEQALAIAEKANQERALAATVFESCPHAIVVTDPAGRVLAANQSFARITGYSNPEILGRTLNLLRSGRHDPSFYAGLWRDVCEQGAWHGELWNRLRNGEIRRHELSITAVRTADLSISHLVGMLQDVTERHEAQEIIRHRALHDELTGLPARAMLLEQLHEALAMRQELGGRVGLLFLDLNGFKPVNDRYGHAVGDDLLRLVSRRLRCSLHSEDLLARLGGDEFVVMVPRAGALEQLQALAEKVETVVVDCSQEFGWPIQLSASIGVARSPDHGLTAEALLGAADAAMYRAKRSHGRWIAMAQSARPVSEQPTTPDLGSNNQRQAERENNL